MKAREIIGCLFVGLGVFFFMGTLYLHSMNPNTLKIFSEKDMLEFIWKNYKNEYIEQGTGRTLDKQRDNITTSEGVAYSMLRAVWMDDKQTFDESFEWANNSLKRPDDSLYSWLYGKKQDGTYGILTERGGQNSASDADTDIALALIFASRRWSDESYLNVARDILQDIWRLEVVSIDGISYLTSNNLENKSPDKVIINPSYLFPAAYRIFADIDTENPWMSLVDSSYALLTKVTEGNLDVKNSAKLPPDWVTLSRVTGEVIPNTEKKLTTNFSYEALRVPWRIMLDYQWFYSDRAKIYLSRLGFLGSEWKSKNKLASVYAHDGKPLATEEVPAMYAGTLGYFMMHDKKSAHEIYTSKLLFLYDVDTNDWKSRLSYYDDNLVWFAIALYNSQLPNLSKK